MSYLAQFVKKLNESPNPSDILVSFEVYKATQKKCVYDYKIITLEQFLKDLSSSTTYNCYHEIIFGNKPCRLFIDLDAKPLDIKQEEEIINQIKTIMAIKFFESYNIPLPDPIILSSSRQDKTSLHMIWPIWFEQACMIRNFILNVFPTPLEHGIVIDPQVYPSDVLTHRTLRMPYSGKLIPSRNKSCFPCIPWKGTPNFDQNIFIKACLTFNQNHHPLFSPCVPTVSGDILKKNPFTVNTNLDYSVVNKVIEWFIIMYNISSISNISSKEDGSFSFRCRIYCFIAGRVHKSNGAYINGLSNSSITQVCMDEECRGKTYKHEFTVQDLLLGYDIKPEFKEKT